MLQFKSINVVWMLSISSPVHVVLFSLLVDQLFGLFLIFLVDQRKNCPVSGNFWSVSEFFVQPFLKIGQPLIFFDIRG